MQFVLLKKGKEIIFRQRHHWIFSGAVASYPDEYVDGDLIRIASWNKEFLGWGFFNRTHSLAGRILSFENKDVYETLKNLLTRAVSLRKDILNHPLTTACRLVNGEGDGLPGLVIDKYASYLVIQAGALGMQKLLPFFVDYFKSIFLIEGIYDKSSVKEEGMDVQERVLWGQIPENVIIQEEGIKYQVDIKKGQKTGFFLDQREMRKCIQSLAYQKRVLNCFSYTGGFTLAALSGGASEVDSVDISSHALSLCKENVYLNGFNTKQVNFYEKDVFDFLKNMHGGYDVVILDPPAFAKKKKDIPQAIKGYKSIFKMALKNLSEGTLFLFSSCSYYISEPLFETLVREVGFETGRNLRVLGRHRHAHDHPINPYHPESGYLKSLLIVV